jgi:hypothetical protein
MIQSGTMTQVENVSAVYWVRLLELLLALSKTASTAIVGGVTSILNHANDASAKGEPLNIFPTKVVTDIATDKLSDHLSEKLPEIKVNGSAAPKLTEAMKRRRGMRPLKLLILLRI